MLVIMILALIMAVVSGVIMGEGEADGDSNAVAFGVFLVFMSVLMGACAYAVKQENLRNLKLNSEAKYDVEVTTTTSPDGKVVSDTTYVYHITSDMLK